MTASLSNETCNSKTMKSNLSNSLRSGLIATLAFAALSLSTFAGPGPQTWIKSPAPAPVAKAKAAGNEKCDQCKTTTKWVVNDRGPVSKGVPGASIAGKIHECGGCTGAVVAQKGKTNDTMIHGKTCGPLVCCR
jgi:hypothetical protein